MFKDIKIFFNSLRTMKPITDHQKVIAASHMIVAMKAAEFSDEDIQKASTALSLLCDKQVDAYRVIDGANKIIEDMGILKGGQSTDGNTDKDTP